MHTVLADLRYSFRLLLKSPGFTAAAVLTLALGIGANTTIFSVVSALLIRPLPVEQPERLVRLHAARRNPGDATAGFTSWSYPDFAEHAARRDVFAGAAAHERRSFLLHGEDGVERVPGLAVTGQYFGVLGIGPLLGRTILPSDDAVGDPAYVAVISRSLWERRFGGDSVILGESMRLDGHDFTVVGVVGAEAVFRPFGEPQVWIPLSTRAAMTPGANPIDTRGVSFIGHVFGRLRPGVSVEQAQAAVDVVARQLATAYPETNAERVAVVTPAGTLRGFSMGVEESRNMHRAAVLLTAVVALVLLIACANVANLLLARTTARRHELGIRFAMGAGRARVARQLLTESIVLALLGAAAGVLLAVWGLDLARRVPEVAELSPSLDGRVLAFTLLAAVGTGILFGLAPIVGLRIRELTDALRSGGRAATRRSRLQPSLIVGQIALSLLLLVASGLVLRTLANLNNVDPGFDTRRLVVAGVTLSAPGARAFDAPAAELVNQLLDEIRALPGVEAVSFSTLIPLSGSRMMNGVAISGYEPAPGEEVAVDVMTVEDRYFRTIGTPLVEGRDFTQLPPTRTDVVLINQTMARRYRSGHSLVGEHITLGTDRLEVVGVVGDMRHVGIAGEPVPMLFWRYPRNAFSWYAVHVRAAGEPASLIAPLRRVLHAAAPDRPVPEVRPMSELVGESLAQANIVAAFFTLFGALALVLAGVGLYGVTAYSVEQRRREIGIRMALGADAVRVRAQVLREGGVLVILGALLGAIAAVATTRMIQGVLYGVEPTDPFAFLASAAALLFAALAATYLPARRATRVDPTIALRSE